MTFGVSPSSVTVSLGMPLSAAMTFTADILPAPAGTDFSPSSAAYKSAIKTPNTARQARHEAMLSQRLGGRLFAFPRPDR